MAKLSLISGFVGLAYCLLFVITTVSGQSIYELRRGNFSVKVSDFGATLLSVVIPDKYGNWDDVALGYETVDEYKKDTTYFGAVLGRVANRIGGAKFTYNGTLYKLVPNEGKNMLHGGAKGFSFVQWQVKKYKKDGLITFTYNSRDSEEGFPGKLKVSVTYMLVQENKLAVIMKAEPIDHPTPVNLALHAYWNLAGHKSGDILSHTVQISGSQFTPLDQDRIPTGKILPVKGTPYDFQEPHTVKSRLNKLPDGYDINYVLNKGIGNHLKKAAAVKDKVSGRKMMLYTNAPGMQFYTGNYLKEEKGKDGAVYEKHGGLALETQGFPDAVNHPNFPSQIVMPGQKYKHVTLYRFACTSLLRT